MPEPSDDVVVLYGDLVELNEVLATVHNFLFVNDLQEQYRSLTNKVQTSRLTKAVRTQQDRIGAYLKEFEDDGEGEDAVQE